MLSPHLIISLLNWTADHFLTLLVFGVFCLVCLVYTSLLLLLVWSGCLLFFCNGSWRRLDFVQVPYQFTLWPPYLMAALCMHQLVNLPVLCMQLNVWNDLAKAKALDGKMKANIAWNGPIWCEINYWLLQSLQSWEIDCSQFGALILVGDRCSLRAILWAPWPHLSRPASPSDSVLSLGCVLSFSFCKFWSCLLVLWTPAWYYWGRA